MELLKLDDVRAEAVLAFLDTSSRREVILPRPATAGWRRFAALCSICYDTTSRAPTSMDASLPSRIKGSLFVLPDISSPKQLAPSSPPSTSKHRRGGVTEPCCSFSTILELESVKPWQFALASSAWTGRSTCGSMARAARSAFALSGRKQQWPCVRWPQMSLPMSPSSATPAAPHSLVTEPLM